MAERPTGVRVQSVARAARILSFLGGTDSAGASLAQVATELGVARSTAHALLGTLETHGLIGKVDGPRFVLGFGLIRLGDVASSQVPIARAARPVLAALSQETGLTTRLAVPEGFYPVFVARVNGSGSVRFQTALGERETPNSSAAGKVLLSELPEEQLQRMAEIDGLPSRTAYTITDTSKLLSELDNVRERGYAVDYEEDLEGVFCVAAGFRDANRRLIGAISITGLVADPRNGDIPDLGATVRRYAEELSMLDD